MKRKAQMEIMGLAVIVILLAVGLFFVAKFTLLKEKPSEEQQYQQSQIGSAFISTLLNSNAGCTGSSASFTKLIQEMAQPQYSTMICGTSGDLKTYFTESVTKIMENTMDVWNYKYRFSVIYPNSAPIDQKEIAIDKGCADSTGSEESKTYYIPSDYGTIRVIMKICY